VQRTAVNSDTYRILQQVDNGRFMYDKHSPLARTPMDLVPKSAQNTLNHL